jgi:RNA polymerase sigma-70 factor (ECF subfamily)
MPAGDPTPAWFEQLYSSSHARIFNLAARIVGDRDDAADITQEVFLRAFTHPPDERGMRNPEPWLYRVAVNACYDHLRRRAGRVTTPLEHAGEIVSRRDGFASAEMTHAVEAALGSLSLRYRTALVLKDLQGLGTAEVAEVMGVSGATARVLLHRSRAAFRRAFRDVAPSEAGALPVFGLAAFLPALAVPAALQAPPLVGALAQAAPVSLAALPTAAASLPAAGVLAKLGAALGVKAAVVIAAATIVTGGAVVTHQLAADARNSAAPTTSADSGPAPTRTGAGAGAADAGAVGAGSVTRKRPGQPGTHAADAGGQASPSGRPDVSGGAGPSDGMQAPASTAGSHSQSQTGGATDPASADSPSAPVKASGDASGGAQDKPAEVGTTR